MTQKSIATQSLWKEGVRGEFKLNTKNLFFDKPYPQRFKEHKKWWLENEENMQVYLGRIYEPKLHSKKITGKLGNGMWGCQRTFLFISILLIIIAPGSVTNRHYHLLKSLN